MLQATKPVSTTQIHSIFPKSSSVSGSFWLILKGQFRQPFIYHSTPTVYPSSSMFEYPILCRPHFHTFPNTILPGTTLNISPVLTAFPRSAVLLSNSNFTYSKSGSVAFIKNLLITFTQPSNIKWTPQLSLYSKSIHVQSYRIISFTNVNAQFFIH